MESTKSSCAAESAVVGSTADLTRSNRFGGVIWKQDANSTNPV